jgi:hypothetical protein
VVHTLAVKPSDESFIRASASSSLATAAIGRIGPNDSSRIKRIDGFIRSSNVGWKKRPRPSTALALPPLTRRAPPSTDQRRELARVIRLGDGAERGLAVGGIAEDVRVHQRATRLDQLRVP